MSDTIDWELLSSYFSDNCTLVEKKKVELWALKNRENKKIKQMLQELGSHETLIASKDDADRLWEELAQRIKSSKQQNISLMKEVEKPGVLHLTKSTIRYKQIAAAFIFGIAIAIFFIFFPPGNNVQLIKVVIPKGEQKEFVFSDNSSVILDAGSIMEYPEKFTGKTREIKFYGEGSFSIRNSQDKIFIVNTEFSRIRVLGTKFNVRTWEETAAVEVTVSEGKVLFTSKTLKQDTDVLIPKGHMSVIKRNGTPSKPIKIDINQYISWRNMKKHFSGVSYSEIIRQIERWYNVEVFTPPDLIVSNNLSIYLDNSSLENILEMLCTLMDFKYILKGNKVFISPK